MSKDDFLVGFVTSITIIGVVGISVSAGYSVGHQYGYRKGSLDTQLYQSATSSFPAKWWIDKAEGKHLYDEADILRTLVPFGNKQ